MNSPIQIAVLYVDRDIVLGVHLKDAQFYKIP